jgi:glucose/arabinose dehydrogenase
MTLGPNHELLLSDSAAAPDGTVYILQGGSRKKLIAGLDRPYGLAFWKEYLYVAEPTSVKRYPYDAIAMTAGAGEEVVSLAGFSSGHWTRTLLFSPDGTKLYVGVGSASNDSPDGPELRAAVNRYNPDGSGHEIVASGTRNPIGLRFYPGTRDLWAAVQERDTLGDDLVPDYLTRLRTGAFYGWPYAYAGANPDPQNGKLRPEMVTRSVPPDILLEPAHVAVLDFLFYTGSKFPKKYRGGAFLAFHGSWNRSKRVGQSIAFIPFADGKPSGPQRDFVTGWMISPDKREVWGRPVGLLELPDGSMLISDDAGKKIWQVTYGR